MDLPIDINNPDWARGAHVLGSSDDVIGGGLQEARTRSRPSQTAAQYKNLLSTDLILASLNHLHPRHTLCISLIMGFLDKFKSKHKKSASKSNEPTYSIQPVPNEPPQAGGGLQNDGPFAPYKATGPQIPNQEALNNLEQPLSREELHRRAEELNK
ncbi:hypothetical protein FRB90_003102 [Tulasnella sp. 427]|nr:hypothetical protein FRB90_003102 [Tulasnella sp. 427]